MSKLNNNGQRVIIVAPHPDDEVIGCGGTILKHIKNGDSVFVVYITNGEIDGLNDKYESLCNIRKKEAKKTAEYAGYQVLFWPDIPSRRIDENRVKIEERLVKIFRTLKPNIIYMPHNNEKDRDHLISNEITKEAYWLSKENFEGKKINNVVAQLRAYEVWTPLKEVGIVANITEFSKQKYEMIELYVSQMKMRNYAKGILGLNMYRAAFYGIDGYCEVFDIVSL